MIHPGTLTLIPKPGLAQDALSHRYTYMATVGVKG